ncbi:MAG: toxin-activating lysine-acyltransferase [Pseudomonadota bacterium]
MWRRSKQTAAASEKPNEQATEPVTTSPEQAVAQAVDARSPPAPFEPPAAEPAPDVGATEDERSKSEPTLLFARLGEIILVLSQDPAYRSMPLGAAQSLITSGLRSGKHSVLRANVAKDDDRTVPVAAAVWASVSSEVDAALERARSKEERFVLEAAHWNSGEHLWLIVLAGRDAARSALIEKLKEGPFKDRDWKQLRSEPASEISTAATAG